MLATVEPRLLAEARITLATMKPHPQASPHIPLVRLTIHRAGAVPPENDSATALGVKIDVHTGDDDDDQPSLYMGSPMEASVLDPAVIEHLLFTIASHIDDSVAGQIPNPQYTIAAEVDNASAAQYSYTIPLSGEHACARGLGPFGAGGFSAGRRSEPQAAHQKRRH